MTRSSFDKAWARRAEKMPNNLRARTQSGLILLQVRKVLDMEPPKWTLANSVFMWNATKMESNVSGSTTV